MARQYQVHSLSGGYDIGRVKGTLRINWRETASDEHYVAIAERHVQNLRQIQ